MNVSPDAFNQIDECSASINSGGFRRQIVGAEFTNKSHNHWVSF